MSAFCDTMVSRLTKAIEHIQSDAKGNRHVNTVELEGIRDDFTAEVIRLRGEMAFYAEPTNWQQPNQSTPAPAVADAGEKARTALDEEAQQQLNAG